MITYGDVVKKNVYDYGKYISKVQLNILIVIFAMSINIGMVFSNIFIISKEPLPVGIISLFLITPIVLLMFTRDIVRRVFYETNTNIDLLNGSLHKGNIDNHTYEVCAGHIHGKIMELRGILKIGFYFLYLVSTVLTLIYLSAIATSSFSVEHYSTNWLYLHYSTNWLYLHFIISAILAYMLIRTVVRIDKFTFL